jgi:DNA-binding transcriptional MocR family regulator
MRPSPAKSKSGSRLRLIQSTQRRLRDLVYASRRRAAARAAKPRLVPAPAKAFADFERSASYGDDRPFNTGRTLVDARTMEAWRKLTHRAARSLGASDLGYTDPCGSIELRRNICGYLQAARGVRCEPEQIVITAGTQHGSTSRSECCWLRPTMCGSKTRAIP